MAIDQTSLDTFIANYQCCAVTKAIELIELKKSGDILFEKKYSEFKYLITSIASLMNLTSSNECLDEETICRYISNIRSICDNCC